MANRHLARTLALQTLFVWDFYQGKFNLDEALEHNKKEFAPEFDDQGFSRHLVEEVIKQHKEIDQFITKYAPEWPLDQITMIDRNVLRIGIYELKFNQEIPPKVAINEAIELAKTFGGAASGKFVNGVLGSIYKQMVTDNEKQDLKSQGIKEQSAGGFVFRREANKIFFVLILDAYDKWTFPKGHIDDNEDPEQAAVREIHEELGLQNLTKVAYLGDTQLKVHRPNEQSYRKLVHLFLFETTDKELTIPKVGELKDGRWFEASEAGEKIGYEDTKKLFTEALNLIKQ